MKTMQEAFCNPIPETTEAKLIRCLKEKDIESIYDYIVIVSLIAVDSLNDNISKEELRAKRNETIEILNKIVKSLE